LRTLKWRSANFINQFCLVLSYFVHHRQCFGGHRPDKTGQTRTVQFKCDKSQKITSKSCTPNRVWILMFEVWTCIGILGDKIRKTASRIQECHDMYIVWYIFSNKLIFLFLLQKKILG
jgi:hypothetical protein